MVYRPSRRDLLAFCRSRSSPEGRHYSDMERGFAVIGLGYVGLPVALALAKEFDPVIGFDISTRRICELRKGKDSTGEVGEFELRQTRLRITHDADALAEASFFLVTV